MAKNDRVVGLFTIGRGSGNKVLPVALQIGGTKDAPLGVAVAYIDLDWLEARLQERTYVAGSSLTIADRNGTILARVPEPERFIGTAIPKAFRYLLTMPEPGTLELTSQDGTWPMVGYSPVTERRLGQYVSAGFATKAAFASTQSIFTRGVVIAFAGIFAALLFAIYTNKVFIARPVQTLLDTVEAWRAGRTDARTGMSAGDGELGRAGHSLDAYIEELLAARTARQQAETQRQMLLSELDHRVKNLLTVIQSDARRTFTRFAAEPEMRSFADRLRAIGDANSLLRQEQWQSASLTNVVKSALAPFMDVSSGRIELSGQLVFLQSDVVLPFSMALHELGTNAAKYGALSNDLGKVSVSWKVAPQPGGDRVDIIWQEFGGLPVIAPTKRGFGSTVIEQVLSSHTAGHVESVYEPAGLFCRMTLIASKDRMVGGCTQGRISAAS
ncbi:MAG: histidine kinase [Candidatus Saccharibacteria bacterium]|nr:histidine kinase [Pseudorhodobacter sp.]